MYFRMIRQCIQELRNLEAWLDKAEAHAAARKFPVDVLLDARLAPDMRNLVYQVQSACDYVKGGAAWLSGRKPPKHEDDERTIAEVRERIRKTVAFAESVEEADYRSAEAQRVGFTWAPGKVMAGPDYLAQMTIPSVFFHVCMAYAILRHNGVDLGKMDYLGPIALVEGRPSVG